MFEHLTLINVCSYVGALLSNWTKLKLIVILYQ